MYCLTPLSFARDIAVTSVIGKRWSVEQWWNDTVREIPMYAEMRLLHWQICNLKSHMNWPGVDTWAASVRGRQLNAWGRPCTICRTGYQRTRTCNDAPNWIRTRDICLQAVQDELQLRKALWHFMITFCPLLLAVRRPCESLSTIYSL